MAYTEEDLKEVALMAREVEAKKEAASEVHEEDSWKEASSLAGVDN